jgi:putative addiction module component (TIGR02574 family)
MLGLVNLAVFASERHSRDCQMAAIRAYNCHMDALSRQLLDTALTLPDSERAILAAELIDSLDPAFDADHEAAWGEEIARRLALLDSGEIRTVPWSEARARIIGER